MAELRALRTFARDRSVGLRNLQLALDALSVSLGMVTAAQLHPSLLPLVPGLKQAAGFSEHALVAYLVLPLWLALVVVVGLQRTFEHPLSLAELLAKLIKLNVFGLLGLAFLQFLTQSIVNRSLVALFLLSSFVIMFVQRTLCYAWTRYQHARGHTRPSLLIVGQPSMRMFEFVRDASSNRLAPLLLGYICRAETVDGLSAPPLDAPPLTHLGALSELEPILEARAVDQVVFFAPYQRPESVPSELAVCEALGVPASFVVDLKQLSRAAPRISELYDHCVISFDVAPKRPEALAIKHGLDPVIAAVLLLLASPLLLLIAGAILLSMGRPIVFSQQRAGRYGRPFRMFKFRTMHNGAEARRSEVLTMNELGGPVFKAREDPRITRLGRFLRKTSLDELPQLFNVIAGTMSMVGPRPLPVQEHEQIRGWQRRRLSVKPGITGLWQISGRSDVDFEQWMLLDLKYVDDWSLWLDLQIALKTVPVVLLGRGAR
jgi:exopolysaccharide biosynthesis polyprenyl glycosylphosphotransferase